MSNFNFSDLATTSFQSNSINYLKPYEIYKVILSKIEKGTIKGTKDPNATYDVVTIEFTSTDENSGVFNTNLFVPNKDSDFERGVNPTSGKVSPSSFDRFRYTLMQITEAINPSGAQKIKDNASKLKTMDDFIGLVIKALTGKKNEVYLKLIGRVNNGTTYSSLPASCFVDKDGNIAPLNFISADRTKLNFSNYEVTQMKQYQNAKPTNMSSVDEESNNESNNDLDDLMDNL